MTKMFSVAHKNWKLVKLNERFLCLFFRKRNIGNLTEREDFKLYCNMMFYMSRLLREKIFEENVWCDGVEALKFKKVGNRKYRFSGEATIVTINSNKWSTCPINGEIEINEVFNGLKKFKFTINRKGTLFILSNAKTNKALLLKTISSGFAYA